MTHPWSHPCPVCGSPTIVDNHCTTCMAELHTCSICMKPYSGFGNNAWPINLDRCCDNCNNLVIKAGLNNISVKRS